MVDAYIEYFRVLAEKHPDIQHDRNQEGQDGDPRLCKFGRFWNEDLYLTSPPGGTMSDEACLQVQLFDMEVDPKTGYFDWGGNYTGGILITKKAITNDTQSQEQCLSDTYNIALGFVKKFWQDAGSMCGGLTFEEGKINLTPVGPIWDSRFGWWITFGLYRKMEFENIDIDFFN